MRRRGQPRQPIGRGDTRHRDAGAVDKTMWPIFDVHLGRPNGVKRQPHAVVVAVVEAFVPGAAGQQCYVVDKNEPPVARL